MLLREWRKITGGECPLHVGGAAPLVSILGRLDREDRRFLVAMIEAEFVWERPEMAFCTSGWEVEVLRCAKKGRDCDAFVEQVVAAHSSPFPRCDPSWDVPLVPLDSPEE